MKNVKQVDRHNLFFSIIFYLSYLLIIGNTEEEIEEHQEITVNEHRNKISNKPKAKFDTNKRSIKNKQQSNQSNQSTIKTDL